MVPNGSYWLGVTTELNKATVKYPGVYCWNKTAVGLELYPATVPMHPQQDVGECSADVCNDSSVSRDVLIPLYMPLLTLQPHRDLLKESK